MFQSRQHEVEDEAMRKVIRAALIGGAFAVGAASMYAASSPSGGRLIPGTGPITDKQIRDKLTADGFSNIQITLRGGIFEAAATKDGRGRAGDRSPTVLQARGDDDDDD
jgi:hypothetical protein